MSAPNPQPLDPEAIQNVLSADPGFVQRLSDEELGETMTTMWNANLDRQQQEVIVTKCLQLITQEEQVAYTAQYRAESVEFTPRGRQQTLSRGPEDFHQGRARESRSEVAPTPTETTLKRSNEPSATVHEEEPTPKRARAPKIKPELLSESSESSPSNSPVAPTPRSRPSITKPALSTRTARIASASSSNINVETVPNPLPNLEMVLWVPDKKQKSKGGYWKTLSDLPASTAQALEAHFASKYLTPDRAAKYKSWHYKVSRNQGGQDGQRCVNNVAYSAGTFKPKYSAENGNTERTCDTCTNTKRLCGKLVKIRGKEKLGLYPLGELRRKGLTWEDLGFWVCE